MQTRADKLFAKETDQHMINREKKILASETKLMQKQQNEMSALRKKIERKINEELKKREQSHFEMV